jgi:transposase
MTTGRSSWPRDEGRRRWRALDLGTTKAFVDAEAPRVECRRHGVIVAAVPWARHESWFTRAFEDQATWLAVNTSASAVAVLMRSTWRAVGGICERVAAEARAQRDLLAGLRRIGFDEISVRKGQRYPDRRRRSPQRAARLGGPRPRPQDSREVSGAAGQRALQASRAGALRHGQLDHRADRRALPQRRDLLDPFHVVKLATDALDEIRREVWNEARRAGEIALARDLKGTRFVLWKNAENLTTGQKLKLARIQKINQRLFRAYLLCQQLRQIYRCDPDAATAVLDAWLKWAWRCRLQPFVKLAATICDQRAGIEAAIRNGLSNARVEQINTQIRLITRRGFGYHSPQAVIALAMLSLGDLCPPLPTTSNDPRNRQ